MFGQSKPGGFGATTTFGAQPTTTSLFGSQQPAQSTGGLFGSTSSGLFGSQPNANPFASSGPVGTTIKFSPLVGQDTAVKNGNQSSVTTKNYCISTMKEYDEKKSLEELRYEDYQAGRKYGTATAPAQSGGLFGQPAAQPTTGKNSVVSKKLNEGEDEFSRAVTTCMLVYWGHYWAVVSKRLKWPRHAGLMLHLPTYSCSTGVLRMACMQVSERLARLSADGGS